MRRTGALLDYLTDTPGKYIFSSNRDYNFPEAIFFLANRYFKIHYENKVINLSYLNSTQLISTFKSNNLQTTFSDVQTFIVILKRS